MPVLLQFAQKNDQLELMTGFAFKSTTTYLPTSWLLALSLPAQQQFEKFKIVQYYIFCNTFFLLLTTKYKVSNLTQRLPRIKSIDCQQSPPFFQFY